MEERKPFRKESHAHRGRRLEKGRYSGGGSRNIYRRKRLNEMSYELKSARYLAKEVLGRAVQPGDVVIDATMGNGHDTLTLCEAVGPEGRVYAFDIQAEAAAETEKLLRSRGVSARARLINDGHERMKEYVKEPVSAAVFNLGWLPGGDHSITTRWETTSQAVAAALDLLKPGGVLVICAYPGHAEGDRERQELAGFLGGLNNREYNVLRQQFLNANAGAPECFVVQKNAG